MVVSEHGSLDSSLDELFLGERREVQVWLLFLPRPAMALDRLDLDRLGLLVLVLVIGMRLLLDQHLETPGRQFTRNVSDRHGHEDTKS